MEHENFAHELTLDYMDRHKQEFTNRLVENAKTAANKGELSASLNYRERIEHMHGFIQTMTAVRDYFREEGFHASIESGDDGAWSPDGNQRLATSCWAQVTIDWSCK